MIIFGWVEDTQPLRVGLGLALGFKLPDSRRKYDNNTQAFSQQSMIPGIHGNTSSGNGNFMKMVKA